jgi:hypothetical protein
MPTAANVESLFEAVRSLSVSDRLLLIERLAHHAAAEIAHGIPRLPGPDSHRARGFDAGRARIADDFDAPLPADIQQAFEGGSTSP